MNIEIVFDKDSIFVRSENIEKRFANLIVIDKTKNKIVDIGHTAEEFAVTAHSLTINVGVEPIFNTEFFDPEKMFLSVIYLVGVIPFGNYSCQVVIPEYESFSMEAKERFEFLLEGERKFKTLAINGKTIFAKDWKYYLARNCLEWGWRLIFIILSLIFASDAASASFLPKSFLIKLLFLSFLFFATIWLVKIAWMIGMQVLLPRKTLRKIFAHSQDNYSPANKFTISHALANRILGKTYSPNN